MRPGCKYARDSGFGLRCNNVPSAEDLWFYPPRNQDLLWRNQTAAELDLGSTIRRDSNTFDPRTLRPRAYDRLWRNQAAAEHNPWTLQPRDYDLIWHNQAAAEPDLGSTIRRDKIIFYALTLLTRVYDRLWRNQAAAEHNPWTLQPCNHDLIWHNQAAAELGLGSTIKRDNNKFQINLNVQHFAPEEICVKIVDGSIVVEGKHDEKADEHGSISRQFVRRYVLPEEYVPEAVTSKLSSDGVLSVEAPRKVVAPIVGERVVQIQKTGPVKKQIGITSQPTTKQEDRA